MLRHAVLPYQASPECLPSIFNFRREPLRQCYVTALGVVHFGHAIDESVQGIDRIEATTSENYSTSNVAFNRLIRAFNAASYKNVYPFDYELLTEK